MELPCKSVSFWNPDHEFPQGALAEYRDTLTVTLDGQVDSGHLRLGHEPKARARGRVNCSIQADGASQTGAAALGLGGLGGHGYDFTDDGFGRNGFGQDFERVVVRIRGVHGVSGDQEDSALRELLTQLGGKGQAIHSRHHDVAKDDVRGLVLRMFEGGQSVIEDVHYKAHALQDEAEGVSNIGFIIDDKDTFVAHRHRGLMKDREMALKNESCYKRNISILNAVFVNCKPKSMRAKRCFHPRERLDFTLERQRAGLATPSKRRALNLIPICKRNRQVQGSSL